MATTDRTVLDELLAVTTYVDDAARGAAGASRTVNPWRWCSFSADTPVATLEGSIPISELTAGAIVLGWDEVVDATGGYTVTDVWVHTDPEIVHLTLDGEAIETTPEHPFYVEGEGWVPAGKLAAGDNLQRANGTVGTLTAVATERYSQPMYNLTVEEAHTFFVGDGQWLVHNDCSPLHDLVTRLHELKSTRQVELNQTTTAVVKFADDQGNIMNVTTNNYHLSPEQVAEAQRMGWHTVQPEPFHQSVSTHGRGTWHAEEIIMWHYENPRFPGMGFPDFTGFRPTDVAASKPVCSRICQPMFAQRYPWVNIHNPKQ